MFCSKTQSWKSCAVKKTVFQGKLSEVLKHSNCILFFAKHCGSPVIPVPLEDNMFIGVCTCSSALCSRSQTIFFTETKTGAGMTYPDYHFMPRRSLLPLLVVLLKLSKSAVPKGKINLHTTGTINHKGWTGEGPLQLKWKFF